VFLIVKNSIQLSKSKIIKIMVLGVVSPSLSLFRKNGIKMIVFQYLQKYISNNINMLVKTVVCVVP
jgi:hypothetical protein